MSWLDKLYTTYENCGSLIGVKDADGKTPLLPVAHSTQNAQIEATIDIHGNFVSAGIIKDKRDAVTIIPVTEDSASRSSDITPHPLFDKLQYVAGDYAKFVGGKKAGEYYGKYISQLEDWCGSTYKNEKVCAILAYLKKRRLISDLVEQKVLVCGKDGKLDPSVKLGVGSQCDAFVRFRVIKADDAEPRAWMDERIRDSYIKYYLSLNKTASLCYASGEERYCSEKHPAKIRNTGDKAKLISGNDNDGFTYRGRFSNKGQAVNVGYDVSQKAHNALKWLIDKQGYRNDEQVVVAWGTRNETLPPAFEDTFTFFPEEEQRLPPTTEEEFAGRLANAIAGYKCDLDNKADVVVLALEAATTGRLSITYYRELNGSEFLERILHWHKTCIWRHTYRSIADGADEKGKTKYRQVSFIGAPAPKDIAYAAYGPNPGGKLVKATVERLLPCIIDNAGVPYDLVNAVVNRVKKPVSMDRYEWEKVRSIACALVKKYREERFKKEVWTLELDKKVTDIHYLYGRLLAVADEIESWALRDMNEERQTNAIRLFERFMQNPSKTWGIIAKQLGPYQKRLGKKCEWLLDIREDISQKLSENLGAAADIRNLDGRFVLGFDCQRKEIRDEILRRKEVRLESNKAEGINKKED